MRGNWRAERARLGMTLEEEARSLGVTKNTAHRWETGESTPRGDSLTRACELFGGVAASYLLEDTTERLSA